MHNEHKGQAHLIITLLSYLLFNIEEDKRDFTTLCLVIIQSILLHFQFNTLLVTSSNYDMQILCKCNILQNKIKHIKYKVMVIANISNNLNIISI